MDAVLSVKDLGIILLGAAIIVLIVYLVLVMKNTIEVLKKTSRVLDDVNEMTAIASSRAAQVDDLMENALVNLAVLLTSMVNRIKRQKQSEEEDFE